MRHLIKQYQWECMPVAFAMGMGVEVSDIYDIVGHDGTEIIFPFLDEPMCRRGLHYNECVDAALRLGFSATPLQLFAQIAATDDRGRIILPSTAFHFDHWIHTARGVLEGTGVACNHAVAFDRGTIYDPDGPQYEYSRSECERQGFYGKRIWIIEKLSDS